MYSKTKVLTNFSHTIHSESLCLRPDSEHELINFFAEKNSNHALARGAGLSYNDSCFNQSDTIIETERLNHLISFNAETGILECQGATKFSDLFLVHPDFIPAVIPGTIHATVAGGIAHDIHGKNNHHASSFGHQVAWIDLLLNDGLIRCSRDTYPELFTATIGGLGLTGVIIRVGIQLTNASRWVQVERQKFDSISHLMEVMATTGLNYDYQVAWVDLVNNPRAILNLANHCSPVSVKEKSAHSIPRLPFGLIKAWNINVFNQLYYKTTKTDTQIQSLVNFNNPLDAIKHWNRLYGPKGLIQFQAVFPQLHALETYNLLLQLINDHKATATLAVLKLFTQEGAGLLSFCKPGFTLAIDFINNDAAKNAIKAMNQLISDIHGRVYLAKDLLLQPDQFKLTYPQHFQFSQVLAQFNCQTTSDLAKRLGIQS